MPKTPASTKSQPKWPRVLLKISGEAFAQDPQTISTTGNATTESVATGAGDQDPVGQDPEGINGATVQYLATEISSLCSSFDVDVAVVVGGGNIWRGVAGVDMGIDHVQADYMGMLATVINALALQDVLEGMGQPTRVQTAIHMAQIAEPYIRRRAVRHLEKGRVVIFAAGTGNPFFTTDTAAALRAVEVEAQVLLKGTHSGTDGIYSADPRHNPDATKFDTLSYFDVINKELKAMDTTAVTLCMENSLPIVMFDLMTPGNTCSLLAGEQVGTLVNTRGQDW